MPAKHQAVGSLQPQLSQKRTDPKNRFGARPTIHCRRSLQGPWHGPSGTQPSPAIESALPAIALATSAPIYLHLCATARELGDRAALAGQLLGPQAIALESETYLD